MSGVYHKRQVIFGRPLHLTLKGLQLQVPIGGVPVIVKPHLTYSHERIRLLQTLLHLLHESPYIRLFRIGILRM